MADRRAGKVPQTRALSPVAIMRLYPGVTEEDVQDALELEARLRGGQPGGGFTR